MALTPDNEYLYSNANLACSSHYLLPAVLDLTQDIPEGSLVADLGCGNGSFLAQFRGRGWRLHGFDGSASGIAEAYKAFPGIEFAQVDLIADLSSLPLAGQCDLVLTTEVVEHVFLPRAFARNCHALLKPGGKLVISTPYHGYLKNLALAISGNMDSHFTALWDYGHIKFWSRRTLGALLAEAGFQVDEFVGCGRLPYLWKSMVLKATAQAR
jgi:2-polyprenyl-6-hydroxyphenyl methylase/3-demethylubiquinone-9 3-methyltransferase